MFDVMEGIIHFALKFGPYILQTKWEFPIGECSPWTNKSSFSLVLWADIDLIVAGKSIHE